jgi:hypothetical protein
LAPGFNVDLSTGRCLQGGDQSFASAIAFETVKLFDGHDHNFVATMHCNMLRPDTAGATDQLAETRLGILKRPVVRPIFADTSHSD